MKDHVKYNKGVEYLWIYMFSGWSDASSLWSEERARTGGRNPFGPRSAHPVQDQGSYPNNNFVSRCFAR